MAKGVGGELSDRSQGRFPYPHRTMAEVAADRQQADTNMIDAEVRAEFYRRKAGRLQSKLEARRG